MVKESMDNFYYLIYSGSASCKLILQCFTHGPYLCYIGSYLFSTAFLKFFAHRRQNKGDTHGIYIEIETCRLPRDCLFFLKNKCRKQKRSRVPRRREYVQVLRYASLQKHRSYNLSISSVAYLNIAEQIQMLHISKIEV